jgi:hypothetical protein
VKTQKLSHKVMACQQEQSTHGMEISALWIEHNAGPVRKPQKQIIVHITRSELLMMMRNPNIQRSWGYDVEFEASTRKPGSNLWVGGEGKLKDCEVQWSWCKKRQD